MNKSEKHASLQPKEKNFPINSVQFLSCKEISTISFLQTTVSVKSDFCVKKLHTLKSNIYENNNDSN